MRVVFRTPWKTRDGIFSASKARLTPFFGAIDSGGPYEQLSPARHVRTLDSVARKRPSTLTRVPKPRVACSTESAFRPSRAGGCCAHSSPASIAPKMGIRRALTAEKMASRVFHHTTTPPQGSTTPEPSFSGVRGISNPHNGVTIDSPFLPTVKRI